MIRDAIRGALAGAAATWLMDLVTTGMLEGEAPFAGHGHLLLLRIGGSPITQILSTMP